MIVIDLEILNPIIPKNKITKSGYTYASGWDDYLGMGIAVVVVYDYMTDTYVYFKNDRLDQLQRVINETDLICGYNNIKFDNEVLRCHNVLIDNNKCYDVLRQIWYSVGLNGIFDYKTHGGYSLDAVIKTNFTGEGKTLESGEFAPYMWQEGKYDQVIEYCKNDVKMTKLLINRIFEFGGIINPKTGEFIKIAIPISHK